MMTSIKALAAAALAVTVVSAPALAGGDVQRGGNGGYSRHAGNGHQMQHLSGGGVGNCYFRGDLGYSVSRDPTVKWAVTNNSWTYVGEGTYDAASNTVTPPAGGFSTPTYDPGAAANWTSTSRYEGDAVTNTQMENAWFGGVGIGCGSGSRGLRGELMLGYTGHRKVDGDPLIYQGPNNPVPGIDDRVLDDPLHFGVKSYTAMLNAYYDLGKWGGITPYVGAGVGVAHNTMSEVWFTDNINLPNKIQGDSRLSLAWSLNAGFGWQVSDRAILDFGYRYMNYGKANSGVIDSAGFINPMVRVDDMSAHEFKVGLRYHFGSSGCGDCGSSHQPLK